jgi:hypothetical protein
MDRFIVGTGRCGSTLLSRMLAQHEEVLSLFEFFTGLDWGRRFRPEPIDGGAFADLVCAEQPFVTAVLRRGYEVEEIVYPFGERGARYRREDPLPWILVTLLPRITPGPDQLFDALRTQASSQPRQRLVEHYRQLFHWLGTRMRRPAWIERSGSSVEYLASLREMFPRGRFLHLHRDGREVALSMREHHAYRLPIALLYDAPADDGTPPSRMGPIDVHAAPTGTDPISRILASRPPPEYFGRYWTDQLQRGSRAIPQLDPGQYMEVGFERLCAEPHHVLREIAVFFDLDGREDWIGRAAALVRGSPPTRFERLPAEQQQALQAACDPGLRLLGRLP